MEVDEGDYLGAADLDDEYDDDGEDNGLENEGHGSIPSFHAVGEPLGGEVHHVAEEHGADYQQVAFDELGRDRYVEIIYNLMDHIADCFHRPRTEEHEAEGDEIEGDEDVGRDAPAGATALAHAFLEFFVSDEECALQSAPDDIHPGGSVPQSSEHHGGHEVGVAAKV